YDMTSSLVGSEMCIRDRSGTATGEDGIVEGEGAFGGFAFADQCGFRNADSSTKSILQTGGSSEP
ncbi:hypothetical protein ACRPFF_11160, partial [Neisseria sp. SLRRB23]|uniref:hypothetical protein n=1 Tax=Neisseria sp. SLRRB23 TaxID=3435199 RepID=UPI003D7FD9DC